MSNVAEFEGKDVLWVVHIGNDDRIALRALEEGFVSIGWSAMGDLSLLDTREKMKEAMQRTWPSWSAGKVRSSYGQPFRFAHEMALGDPIVFPVRPTGEIAIGRIAGPYEWKQDDRELVERDHCNVRAVEWLSQVPRTTFTQAALHSFGSFMSVSTSNDYLEEVIAVLRGEVPPEGTDEASGEWAADLEEEGEGVNLYEEALQETEDYLLKAWRRSGTAFEHVVAAVFEALGYSATVTPGSGDGGVDVIAHPDPLGLETPFIKIQAKSGTGTVGEPEVNQLKGALHPGEKGVFVSLGSFSNKAKSAADGSPDITLVGAKKFVELFITYYNELDASWRARFPLKGVMVPVSSGG